ncbi:MAG: 50S ribosomal protein L19 [Candidatus Gracilibacteria bacterium]|jgi:large subunit ribosomal protein L19
MNILKEIQDLAKKPTPEINVGSTVKIHQKIKEGEKERIQMFEGLVIAKNSGNGADATFTVRKVVEGIGVEKVFPLYSANIVKIEVKKVSKIRRAKLYYMRSRSGKSARLQETYVSNADLEESIAKLAEQKAKEDAAKEDRDSKEAVNLDA